MSLFRTKDRGLPVRLCSLLLNTGVLASELCDPSKPQLANQCQPGPWAVSCGADTVMSVMLLGQGLAHGKSFCVLAVTTAAVPSRLWPGVSSSRAALPWLRLESAEALYPEVPVPGAHLAILS